MNMTSNCDVTNSAHQTQMTTICHWMNPPMKIFCVRCWQRPPGVLWSSGCKSQALMRLPVSHIVVYQVCATFLTEGPNAVKQIRPRTPPSFHTGCLVRVTGIKIHFVVLHLARGLQVAHPVAYYRWCKYGNYIKQVNYIINIFLSH